MAWKDTIKNAILWNNISLTDTTIAKRAHLAAVMDKFTTFNWRGYNAFDSFGAFIINGGGDLKFYNGPNFKNEYTQPQFETSNGSLMGVTFEKQTISFKVGVYWISEDDFRQFINWLNPYEINTLSFGFEPNFLYTVKLANRQDSPRYILGYEGRVRNGSANSTPSYSSEITADVDSRPMYYSEMTLTFELQGTPCARAVRPYEWSPGTQNSGYTWGFDSSKNCYRSSIVNNSDYIKSDLQTPLNAVFSFNLQTNESVITALNLTLNLSAHYNIKSANNIEQNYSTNLFNIELTNLNIANLIAAYTANPYIWSSEDKKVGTQIGRANAYLQNKLQKRADDRLLKSSDIYEVWGKDNQEQNDRRQLTPMVSPLDNTPNTLNIRYDSESGLVFLQYGSSVEKLLNLLNSSTSGDRIVNSYNVKKFYIPGMFDNPAFDINNFHLELTFKATDAAGADILMANFFNTATTDSYIESYARTNVI